MPHLLVLRQCEQVLLFFFFFLSFFLCKINENIKVSNRLNPVHTEKRADQPPGASCFLQDVNAELDSILCRQVKFNFLQILCTFTAVLATSHLQQVRPGCETGRMICAVLQFS